MEELIVLAKTNFLNRFNPDRTIEEALNKAVNRSVQRAYVYTPGVSNERKSDIRKFWKQQLVDLGEKYVVVQPLGVFERDLLQLQKRMNLEFPNDFNNPKCVTCPSQFRLAQAQKSLSLYLKHLWCMELIPLPPVCPVDTLILRKTAIAEECRNWICVCTIEEYRNRLDAINVAAGELSFVEWELLNY